MCSRPYSVKCGRLVTHSLNVVVLNPNVVTITSAKERLIFLLHFQSEKYFVAFFR